jgi:hypothetical protein
MAAEVLSSHGVAVHVYDAMPSVGRKFLLAGRGGLNLTHAEPLDRFVTRLRPSEPRLQAMVRAFPPDAMRAYPAIEIIDRTPLTPGADGAIQYGYMGVDSQWDMHSSVEYVNAEWMGLARCLPVHDVSWTMRGLRNTTFTEWYTLSQEVNTKLVSAFIAPPSSTTPDK